MTQRTPAPFTTVAIIFAILIGGICAPLVLPILVAAYLIQRRFNGRRREAYDRAYAKALDRHDRERAQALRYFAS